MSGPFDFIEDGLEAAARAGLRRRLRVSESPSGPQIRLDGQTLTQFASNNYLGLAAHPLVVRAFQQAAERYGVGTGASRLLAGTHGLHEQLEAALAQLKGVESALVYGSGSLANIGALSALAEEGDLIIFDKLVHASLYDGARLSGAELQRYPHNDLARLEALLNEEGARSATRKIIVVVEAVYSMDGDIAPLSELLALTRKHSALLLIDEAHSTGVLGATGRGIFEHFGLPVPEHVVISGTLSKALGGLGGFVAGPRLVRDWLIQRSRALIFATSLPAPNAAAALEALAVLQREPGLLTVLRERVSQARQQLAALGWQLGSAATPIIPLVLGSPEAAIVAQDRLLKDGYYVPAIRPPTVPANACRLRMSLMAGHSAEQVAGFCTALGAPHASA